MVFYHPNKLSDIDNLKSEECKKVEDEIIVNPM